MFRRGAHLAVLQAVASQRGGMSIIDVQRETGLSYQFAWRILQVAHQHCLVGYIADTGRYVAMVNGRRIANGLPRVTCDRRGRITGVLEMEA